MAVKQKKKIHHSSHTTEIYILYLSLKPGFSLTIPRPSTPAVFTTDTALCAASYVPSWSRHCSLGESPLMVVTQTVSSLQLPLRERHEATQLALLDTFCCRQYVHSLSQARNASLPQETIRIHTYTCTYTRTSWFDCRNKIVAQRCISYWQHSTTTIIINV